MTIEASLALFALLDVAQKMRVLRLFEQTRYSPSFRTLDDAFVGAVMDCAFDGELRIVHKWTSQGTK